jgi:hypothetical protein
VRGLDRECEGDCCGEDDLRMGSESAVAIASGFCVTCPLPGAARAGRTGELLAGGSGSGETKGNAKFSDAGNDSCDVCGVSNGGAGWEPDI